MKNSPLISLILFLVLSINLSAQDLIENTDVKVLIPAELKPIAGKDKSIWQFSSGDLTYMVTEMKSGESADEYLGGWAKYISKGNHWFTNNKIDGNKVATLIMETKPEGITFNNEMLAFDNTLYKSVYKNNARIYSFAISYPKKDSLQYAALISKIKNSITIKNKVFELTNSSTKDSLTVVAPAVAFADVWSEGCSIHSPFISMLTFKKSSLAFEETVKEEKSFFKRTGTKKISKTDTTINGIKTVILKGSGKNENYKGQCVFTTTYFFEIGSNTWKVNYTMYQSCNDPIDDQHLRKIIESIRYMSRK